MKLYLLGRDHHNYDEFDAKLIRADTKKQAVDIANERCGGEGKVWGDEKHITCKVITVEGEEEEIITSFLGG